MQPVSSDQPKRDPDWAYTVAVVLVALLPRVFVALAWAREPVWDGHYYHFGATRLAEGFGYSETVLVGSEPIIKPWSHYPIGYSAFLAALYTLFGSGLAVAPLANAGVGAALAGLTHRLSRYFLSENRARIAGALTALHPGLIIYSAVLMTEPLAATLLVIAGLIALRLHGRLGGMMAGGAVAGIATLVRPASLLAAPLLALMTPRPWGRMLARAVVATSFAVIAVLPWTIRNCAVMDGCAFVSTNGGWNLAIGALTKTGRFTTLKASDGCPVVTGQVQQDRCWARVGVRAIRADPIGYLSEVPKKLAQTYDHESFAIEYLHEAAPAAWPAARRVAGRGLMTGAHQLLLVVAALGVIAFPGRALPIGARAVQGALLVATGAVATYAWTHHGESFYLLPALLPVVALARLPGAPPIGAAGRYLLGLLVITTVTHAVFFGDDRYHLVITPALCILAAGALRSDKGIAAPRAP